MPLEHLLKDALAIPLNHIAMTRNNPLKPPLINPGNRLRKSRPITRTRPIPNHALLPNRRTLCIRQRAENLGQDAAIRLHARPAELLRRRQIEHEIGGDEGARGLVVEHELLVDVGGDVFPVELCVEFGGDGGDGFGFAEDECKGDVFVFLFCALLRQGFGAEDLCVGVGLVPGAEEDVVLCGFVRMWEGR